MFTWGSATAAPLMSCHETGVESSSCPHGISPWLHSFARLALTWRWAGLLNQTCSDDKTYKQVRSLAQN